MPYSAGRMLASKIAYSARNSAGRIYPSLLLKEVHLVKLRYLTRPQGFKQFVLLISLAQTALLQRVFVISVISFILNILSSV